MLAAETISRSNSINQSDTEMQDDITIIQEFKRETWVSFARTYETICTDNADCK